MIYHRGGHCENSLWEPEQLAIPQAGTVRVHSEKVIAFFKFYITICPIECGE